MHEDTIPCPNCSGECCVRDDEETFDRGRLVTDVCYHCSGTGRVPASERVEILAARVASFRAYSAWAAFSRYHEEDGDGIALYAAENGLRVDEYRRLWMDEYVTQRASKLARRSEKWLERAWAACERRSEKNLATQNAELAAEAERRRVPQVPGKVLDDDCIPF